METLEFDASNEGIPDGVRVDALTLDASNALLLSFDTTVDLGSGLVVADEDIVSFDGVDFSLYFDGSAEGLAEGVDLDGAFLDVDQGVLFVSFDVSGEIGGIDFADEDILEFDLGSTWSIAYDGSVEHADLEHADVNVVPEPTRIVSLVTGAAGLWVLSRLRARRMEAVERGSSLPGCLTASKTEDLK